MKAAHHLFSLSLTRLRNSVDTEDWTSLWTHTQAVGLAELLQATWTLEFASRLGTPVRSPDFPFFSWECLPPLSLLVVENHF